MISLLQRKSLLILRWETSRKRKGPPGLAHKWKSWEIGKTREEDLGEVRQMTDGRVVSGFTSRSVGRELISTTVLSYSSSFGDGLRIQSK